MTNKTIKIGDLPWALWRTGRKVAFSLLPVRAHVELAVLRGWLHGRFSPAPNHVRANIESTFAGKYSDSEIRDIIRRYISFRKRYYITRILPKLKGFNNVEWSVEGLSHLDQALDRNRGVLLVSAHLGHVRLIPPVLRGRGYDVRKVAAGGHDVPKRRKRRERMLAASSKFRNVVRERTRIRVNVREPEDIPATLDVRPIFDALAQNQAVLILGDGLRSSQFLKLPLLGRPYPYPVGFMKIAKMTGASILPTFALENERGSVITIKINPPLELSSSANIDANVEAVARALDSAVTGSPHLWHQWKHPDCFDWAMQRAERDIGQRHINQ